MANIATVGLENFLESKDFSHHIGWIINARKIEPVVSFETVNLEQFEVKFYDSGPAGDNVRNPKVSGNPCFGRLVGER